MSEGIEYSKDDVQRKLVNCEQERTILLQEIKEARIELDMLRQQVDFERRRFQDIESVLTEVWYINWLKSDFGRRGRHSIETVLTYRTWRMRR